jgi:Zn-finger in ubiquitin-hydrolases and other protein
MAIAGVDPSVAPSGTGCFECDAAGGWWVHLRRCAQCGHIGCCDSSPMQHASKHAASTGHPIVQSFEPGEDWFWDYARQDYYDGPRLPDPQSRPLSQPTPGPEGRVPPDWRSKVH